MIIKPREETGNDALSKFTGFFLVLPLVLKDGRKRIISRCNILYTRKKDGKKKNSI